MTTAARLLREAGPDDVVALEAFLALHPETSMFLRGNLAQYGVRNSEHRYGTTYWLKGSRGIEAVVACSNGGYLMCQAPNQGPEFWDAAARVLAGRSVEGITGVPDQVDAWVTALGLKIEAFAVKETEPLYRLDLEELRKPNTSDITLRRPSPLDRGVLCKWFEGYSRDTGMRPTDGATSEAAAETFSQHDAARILELNGEPVAMTSLNARVTDTVQIGGVYVPDVWRGRGFGGAAVALQLAELKAQGAKTAILFAANEVAAKAYERIGFNLIGGYEIALLKAPLKVEGNDDVFQA